MPLQRGYSEHPQKDLPALAPRLASRRFIALEHTGQLSDCWVETGLDLRLSPEAGFGVASVLRDLYQDRPAALTNNRGNAYCPKVARPFSIGISYFGLRAYANQSVAISAAPGKSMDYLIPIAHTNNVPTIDNWGFW